MINVKNTKILEQWRFFVCKKLYLCRERECCNIFWVGRGPWRFVLFCLEFENCSARHSSKHIIFVRIPVAGAYLRRALKIRHSGKKYCETCAHWSGMFYIWSTNGDDDNKRDLRDILYAVVMIDSRQNAHRRW